MPTNIGLSRDQVVFAVSESVKGTLAYPAGMKKAKGTITVSAPPDADDTLTIGAREFVFKAARAGAGEIAIGLGASDTVTNILAAIAADIPTVATAEDGAGDTVIVTALASGRAGNSVAFLASASGVAVNGAGTLGGTQAGSDGEQIVGTDHCNIHQDAAFEDSPEINEGTTDVLERFGMQTGPGEWNLSFLLRADGAGYPPMADVVFECLMGEKTVNAGTSVVYTFGEKPSFSLWCLEGHAMKFASGCSVDQVEFEISGKSAVKVSASGRCMRVYTCGTGALSGAEAAAQTVLSVANAKLFDIGSRIKNATTANNGDNSGAGYTVTDRSISADGLTDTITISPAVPGGGWSENDAIAPFLPPGMRIGTAGAGYKAVLTYAGAGKAIAGCKITIKNAAHFLEDEITPSGYVEDFIDGERGDREVSAEIDALFRKADAAEFYEAINGSVRAFSLLVDGGAGKRFRMDIPYGRAQVPKPEFSGPAIKLPVNIKGYGSSGEDSASFRFY